MSAIITSNFCSKIQIWVLFIISKEKPYRPIIRSSMALDIRVKSSPYMMSEGFLEASRQSFCSPATITSRYMTSRHSGSCRFMSLFDRWISNSIFKQQSKENGFAIYYDPPSPISFDLDQDIRIEIEFDCFQPSTQNTTKVNLNEFAFVKFISRESTIPLQNS